MAATLRYETVTCSRCGGSGHYSYCSMYGTTCFKCRGRKTHLSRAGASAAAKINAFLSDNFTVKAEDLTVGDRIKVEGVTRTVTAVEVATEPTGWSESNGVRTPTYHVGLTFNKPVRSAFGAYSSLGTSKGATFLRAVAGADWDKVVAYARTLVKRRMKGLTIVEAAEEAVAS